MFSSFSAGIISSTVLPVKVRMPKVIREAGVKIWVTSDTRMPPPKISRPRFQWFRLSRQQKPKSVRNAIRCGFRPAWVEMTAKDTAFVDEMNRG